MKDIQKLNLKDMLHLVHSEMTRIKNLKCPADKKMVDEHIKKLENLTERTIRIETAAYVTIALITIFGIIVGFLEYKSKKLETGKSIEQQIAGQK